MERLLMCLGIILIPAASASFRCSQRKLVAAVGSDILLPCNLSTPLNRTGLEIRWFYNLFHSLVFLMRKEGKKDRIRLQRFRGRAFLRDGPETWETWRSHCSTVRLSDAGAFHCFVEDVSNQIYEEGSCESQHCGVIFTVELKHSLSGLETGAYIIVSEALFPRVSLWMISFILLLIILVSLLAVASWAYCRFKREKERDLRIKNNQLDLLRREIEWRKVSVYKESIFFDPLTAFHGLLISPDRRVISTTDIEQNLPENPERFDTEPCVLGSNSFSSGCHYWETEIQERDGQFWSLGIARQSVRRMGGQRESPESGIWAIRGTADGLFGLSEPQKLINCTNRLNKVGTFLDYERETLSFYDVETFECLFQYTQQFTEPVYPYYYVGPGMSFVLNSQSHR
ncbi:LOW QUALITY PROTEIN: butyrophilin subfamily 1 member A1-like [Bombina bombina]|uniref:LOW QUALITY PROTEIN: butyrophilin subfamily 1 member A1-like n=1 Tax=Bombina bombina TaxID=8345 RepID=UPI00235A65D7|nr:LOW QUALITY PROTEIN: butyrophilin subfamily 1 member A1-like [Bombina bombina]